MLYKMSLSVSEIPPLFVQLDKLEKKENDEYLYWKEKARLFEITISKFLKILNIHNFDLKIQMDKI